MSLKDKVSEINNIKDDILLCYETIKKVLSEKGVEIEDEDKLLDMINKINEMKTGIEGADKLPPWYQIIEKIEDIWINGSRMITERHGLISGTVDDKIYCIGGYINNINYLNNNECYDTNNDTWTTKKAMITKRRELTSGTVDNKIYCIGGYDNNYLNNNECYDTNSDTWTTMKVMTTKRDSLTSSTVNNKIYCIGGYYYNNNNEDYLNNNECYDTNSDTWTTKKVMITKRDRLTSGTVDNKIYCIGGYYYDKGDKYLNKNECYDTNSNTWTTKKEMTTKRSSLTSSTVNNKIYCIGGGNGSYLNNNEIYIP